MTYTPLSIARRHVLGDLYGRCDDIETVPVYLGNEGGIQLGFADQSLGKYADAFSFHLNEAVCKKLSSGYFRYSLGYDFAEEHAAGQPRRIRLNFICLTPLAVAAKPVV
jgi:hypothetical protein